MTVIIKQRSYVGNTQPRSRGADQGTSIGLVGNAIVYIDIDGNPRYKLILHIMTAVRLLY